MVKPPAALKSPVLNYNQAFDPGDVQALDTEIDFSKIDSKDIHWVKGNGQQVHWKGSNVTVFEKDSEGKSKHTTLASKDGSLKVALGVELYITGGKCTEK
jgi:hypothetical protein